MVSLKQARIESGLKTGFIVKFLGCGYTTLYYYENGERKVPDNKKGIFKHLYGRDDIDFSK